MNKPYVPDPSFVVEYASYENDDFEKNIEKYFKEGEMSKEERVYLSEFEATVFELKEHLKKLEKKYSSKSKELDKREEKDIQKIEKVADMELSTVSRIYEGVKGTADRIIPTLASYIAVKAAMNAEILPKEFEDLPALIAGATLFLSHAALNKYGESMKGKVIERKERKEERTEQKYKFLRDKLELEKDRKKRKIISRAERKLKKIYKEYFGEYHPTETSAEYFFRKEKINK